MGIGGRGERLSYVVRIVRDEFYGWGIGIMVFTALDRFECRDMNGLKSFTKQGQG